MSFQRQEALENQSALDMAMKSCAEQGSTISQKSSIIITITEYDNATSLIAHARSGNLPTFSCIRPGPPRDSGIAAVKMLVAATFVQSVILGIPYCFGVFHDFYVNHTNFSGRDQSAWIGVLSLGLAYLGAPGVTYLCENKSWPRQYYIWVGWFVTLISLVLAAFCKSIALLAVTQGLMFGIGSIFLDLPILIILNTWFLKRRGLAYGIAFGFTDLCGFGWTFLTSFLLSRHGLRNTFLIMAALIAITTGPVIIFLTERPVSITELNPASDSVVTEVIKTTTIKPKPYYIQPIFYIFALSNFLQSIAVNIPFIYLPAFTTSMGFSTSRAATVLAIANMAMILGEITFGKLSDHMNVNILIIICAAGASLVSFLLWGLATSYIFLVVFALLYGYFAAGFIALWARMGTYFGEKDAQIVYSVMCAGRGAASIISAPISAALMNLAPKIKGYGGQGGYLGIILFVGVSMAASALLGCIGLVTVWNRKSIPTQKFDLEKSDA